MRLIKFFKPLFGLLLLLLIMSSCKKEELTTTGTLKVTYTNFISDLNIAISPAENSEINIIDRLKTDNKGTLTYNLNVGNYILISSSQIFYPKVGFQIRAGETTVINFDLTNDGHVQ